MNDRYVHKTWRVRAIQFTGSNFSDVRDFLIKYLGEECNPRNDFDIRSPDYMPNMVQFYAWNDDREVDPGMWIVIHRSNNSREGEILCSSEFEDAYGSERQ